VADDFGARVAAVYRDGAPLVAFLCKALGLPF